MDFRQYLYRTIGHRIRIRRKNMKFKQTDFEGIDYGILSRVENGKAEANRNPYLLNDYQLSVLQSTLGYKDCSEIVWGTVEERENFVKMILLFILISGGEFGVDVIDNPFINQEDSNNLIRWAKKQTCLPIELYKDVSSYIYAYEHINIKHNFDENTYNYCLDTLKNKELIVNKINTFFTQEYKFFYYNDNFQIYENYFKNTTPNERIKLQPLADTILRQLLHDYNFAKFYSTCVHNYLFNVSGQKAELNIKVKRFLLHPSTCIDFAFDYKYNHNASFIYAFNKNWNKYKDKYMTYFDAKLFHNPDIEKKGLQIFTNDFFMSIISSSEFHDVCNTISVIDTYFEPESILATNYFNTMLQQLIQSNNLLINNKPNETFLSYLSKSIVSIDKCASSILN